MNTKTPLREARKRLKLTQGALATALDVNIRTVVGIERGEREASPKIMAGVQRLMAAYNGDDDVVCTPDEARLIHIYRGLPAGARAAVITTAEALGTAAAP